MLLTGSKKKKKIDGNSWIPRCQPDFGLVYSTTGGSLWPTVRTVLISCPVISISLDHLRSMWLTIYFAEEIVKDGVTSWVQQLGTDFFYARMYGGLMFIVCCLCVTYTFTRANPIISRIVKKIDLICSYKFETVVPFRSTTPMTGCSDPSAVPTAGNIVWNLQRKWCEGLPAILVEPVQHQQNASLLATKQNGVDKKNQLDVIFCILYFSSNSCSTCFGQPCAHHQELTTVWCYSLVLVCAVAAGRLSRLVGR